MHYWEKLFHINNKAVFKEHSKLESDLHQELGKPDEFEKAQNIESTSDLREHFSELIGIGTEEEVYEIAQQIETLPEKIENIKDGKLKKRAVVRAFHLIKKNIGKIAGAAALFSTASSTASYYATRYTVTETKTTDGIRYEHEDPETTKNLNYLLGKDPLPEDLKIEMYRSSLAEEYLTLAFDVPEELSHMSAVELRKKHADLHEGIFGGGSEQKKRADEEFDGVGQFMQFDPRAYRVIWEMQKELGSPKIRFIFDKPGQKGEDLKTQIRAGRAYYIAPSNTLYINPLHKGRDWLAEMAHAKQYNDNPLRAYALHYASEIRSEYRSISEGKTYRQAYDKYEYDTPGTLENEAHHVMEQEIMRKIEDAYKKDHLG